MNDWELATVVGISSAFPPVLSPVLLSADPGKWIRGKYAVCFDQVEYRQKLFLTDGGVYDNMGMEACGKNSTMNLPAAIVPFRRTGRMILTSC